MPDDAPTNRHYSEKEIRQILKRAAAMQEEVASESAGLSLEELQQVAAEAGIDPRFVVAAASELGRGGAERPSFHLLGGAVSILQERTVEGTLTEGQREEMLAEIRKRFRRAGTVSQVGRTLEWTHSEHGDQQQVSITSRGGRTQIRVFERFPRITILTFTMPLAIMLQAAVTVPAILGFGALEGWAWALGLLAATFLAARFGYSRIVRRKERRARELLDRLAHLAAAPVQEGPVAAAAHADPALAGEEADDVEQASDSVRTRRRASS